MAIEPALFALGLIAVAAGQQCVGNVQTLSIAANSQRDRLGGVRQAARVLIRNCGDCTEIDTAECIVGITAEMMILLNPQLSSVSFPHLLSVGSHLRIEDNPGLSSISMPSLTQAGQSNQGSIFRIRNSAATEVVLNRLALAENLIFADNAAMTLLSLGGLVSVDGELTVSNNSRLAGFNNNVNAPAFLGLLSAGVLSIVGNAALTTIRGFFGLISCTSVDISDNAALTIIDGFRTLASTASITIADCASLRRVIGFYRINFVNGPVSIERNPALRSVEFMNNCSRIEGAVTIANTGVTDLAGLARLQEVGGNFVSANNTAMVNLDALDSLVNVNGTVTITNNTGLASIAGLNELVCVHTAVQIMDNPALDVISGFDSLAEVQCDGADDPVSIEVTGNSVLRTISGFNRIASVGSLSITDNHNGQDGRSGIGMAGFGNLTFANTGVNISANGNIFLISGLGAASTRSSSASGPLTVDRNDGLAMISTNGFRNFAITESVSIRRNPSLTAVSGFRGLTSTTDGLEVSVNVVLTRITGFTNLTNVTNLAIYGNSRLRSISGLAGLRRIVGTIRFNNNNLDADAYVEAFNGTLECHDGVYNGDAAAFCQNCPDWLINLQRCTPTESPTNTPSTAPSSQPTTGSPTEAPTTSNPTTSPIPAPTASPTTPGPSEVPSSRPTRGPLASRPTIAPTFGPTGSPSVTPTSRPTALPNNIPTGVPTSSPSGAPTAEPTRLPSVLPTYGPTAQPSGAPTGNPTMGAPTSSPTAVPSTSIPTVIPSAIPTSAPSATPIAMPTCDAPPLIDASPVDASAASKDGDAAVSSSCIIAIIVLALLLLLSLAGNVHQWKSAGRIRLENATVAWKDTFQNPGFEAGRDALNNPTYVGTDSFAATGKPDNGADEASYATVPGGGVGEAGYMPVLPVNTVGESGVKPDTGVDESSYATVSATGTSDVLNAIGLNRNGYTDVAPVPESDDPDGFIWNEGGYTDVAPDPQQDGDMAGGYVDVADLGQANDVDFKDFGGFDGTDI